MLGGAKQVMVARSVKQTDQMKILFDAVVGEFRYANV
jgi:hypothetical protein